MYQLNTFNIPKIRLPINGEVREGDATKKLPENTMKLRES